MEDKMSLEIKIVNATINIFKEKGVKLELGNGYLEIYYG